MAVPEYPIPRLRDVLETAGQLLATLIQTYQTSNSLNFTCQVFAGQVVTTELAKTLAQGNGNSAVAVYPLPGKAATRYSALDSPKIVNPTPTLFAVVSNGAVTFTGNPQTGVNIHVFVGVPVVDVFYTVLAGDTLNSIASNIATAINNTSVPGVSATANNGTVSVTNSPLLVVNLGGIGTLQREVSRVSRVLQFTVYSPDPYTRGYIGDAIIQGFGTSISHFYPMSDGVLVFMKYHSDQYIEKAQSSYSCYEHVLFFDVEYPNTQTYPNTDVGEIQITQTVTPPGITTTRYVD